MQANAAIIVLASGERGFKLVERLADQTRQADHIFALSSRPEDLAGLDKTNQRLSAAIVREGRAAQLNDAIALTGGRFRYLFFFDDDFIPSRFYLERAVAIFEAGGDIVGLSGRLLADEDLSGSISREEGAFLVDYNEGLAEPLPGTQKAQPLQGSNMAIRQAALGMTRFDEALPVAGYMEDVDFSAAAARYGKIIRADSLFGVKACLLSARENGRQTGYAQVANALYLARKGRLTYGFALSSIAGKLISNLLHLFWFASAIDYRQRLGGNFAAIGDLLRRSHQPLAVQAEAQPESASRMG